MLPLPKLFVHPASAGFARPIWGPLAEAGWPTLYCRQFIYQFMLTYILFPLGFVFVIKGADFLVTGASSLAKKLKVSDLVIGLTVVAFGTSAPELVVNVIASLQDRAEIAIGNILGSNIANILLILGVAAVITELKIQKGTVWKEIPLSLLAALLVGVMANDALVDGMNFSLLTRSDGLALLAFFIIFMYYTFGIAKNGNEDIPDGTKEFSIPASLGLIALGLTGLVFGGKWVVDGAVMLALAMGVSESLVGLTIVAVGTSLPELATSAVAALKKKADIAVGNVVGSNIFNIFFVLGISSVIKPLPFSPASNVDIGLTIGASLILFALMFVGKKHHLTRWEGLTFLAIYASYIGYLIMRG